MIFQGKGNVAIHDSGQRKQSYLFCSILPQDCVEIIWRQLQQRDVQKSCLRSVYCYLNELQHHKTNKITCAPNKDSAQLYSLISVFAVCSLDS